MNKEFLDELMAWNVRESEKLRSAGTDVVLKGPTIGFSKNSVGLELTSPSRVMTVVVWDSGEYEVITALEDLGWELDVEVGDLPDPKSVASLLDRVTTAPPGIGPAE